MLYRATWPLKILCHIGAIASCCVGMAAGSTEATAQPSEKQICPSALERIQPYRTASGETLDGIAADRQLLPATLRQFNPGVGNSPATGTELLIPPFNGTVVNVGAGETWQSLAKRYGSRADILFEVNGCASEVPNRVFIPGGVTVASRATQTSLPGYPLAQPSAIALSYGWQPHATRDELVFNSGIAFTVSAPTGVLAVEAGTVAFAGERAGYGNLVVINHSQGLQTRYANLSEVTVSVGQAVGADASVGSVGGDTPTYLYFEVRKNSASGWVAEDPGKYLPALELR